MDIHRILDEMIQKMSGPGCTAASPLLDMGITSLIIPENRHRIVIIMKQVDQELKLEPGVRVVSYNNKPLVCIFETQLLGHLWTDLSEIAHTDQGRV